ncbi:uncharacterized protein LOC125543766 [Triticum urartu]|uniref:uncharacterized protein LOC125543766 n=1 Tax=Triticum urartu TaxID=4572 RepID=UPI0020436E51|nr:uncharacterized protein LOC125543766 [Triticum urartu]
MEIKRANDREWYAGMTHEQKHAKSAQRTSRRNTLSQDSLAMENPFYTSKIVRENASLFGPNGSVVRRDWSIPELIGSPIYIQPTSEDISCAETPDMGVSTEPWRKHVTPRERQALMDRQNQAFHANGRKNRPTSMDENSSIAPDSINGFEHPPQSVIINNESTLRMCDPGEIHLAPNDGVNESLDQNPAMTVEGVNDFELPSQSVLVTNGDEEGVILEEDSEDEEGYMFAGMDEDNDEDVEMEEVDDDDDSASISNIPDPYDMVYRKLPTETHKLKSVEDCKHCCAKKFERESKSFCCRKGKIKLANPDTPPELMRLWTSADSDARHFRGNIRFFNGHFSFTSLYCHLDSDTTNISKHPIYTFRAHGQMYHDIQSFGKQDGLDRSHLELYFYDDDPSLEHRYRSCRKEKCQKDKEVITQLVNILRGNPYSEHLGVWAMLMMLMTIAYHLTLTSGWIKEHIMRQPLQK